MTHKPSFTKNEKRAMIGAMEFAIKGLLALVERGDQEEMIIAYKNEERVLRECIRKVRQT
jgi:hypothetical protein